MMDSVAHLFDRAARGVDALGPPRGAALDERTGRAAARAGLSAAWARLSAGGPAGLAASCSSAITAHTPRMSSGVSGTPVPSGARRTAPRHELPAAPSFGHDSRPLVHHPCRP